MMIPASKCNPTICLDCGARLPKFKLESKVTVYPTAIGHGLRMELIRSAKNS